MKPKSRALMKPLPIWITYFEREVAAIQDRVNKLRAMEQLYNIALSSLASRDFPNDRKCEAHPDGITITITLTEHNHWNHFEWLANAIAQSLHEANLRSDTTPPNPTIATDVIWVFRLGTTRTIRLVLDVPWGGTRYCKVTFITKPTTYVDRVAVWHDSPLTSEPNT